MFGKINLGFASQKINQNNQNTHQNNNNNVKPNKPFLSNPKFVAVETISDTKKLNGKQLKTDSNNFKETQKDSQKTKQIKKFESSKQQAQKKEQIKSSKNKLSAQNQMQGSKFRILNELLYTSSSQQAMNHFKENPEDYMTYHQGYRFQSEKWQSKPVNILIKSFRKSFKHYKDKIICDLGCGQGFLYEGLTKECYQKQDQEGKQVQVKNKHCFEKDHILSYDLVSLKPYIQIADIKNLPLKESSVDVAVFCLSLMGKNYIEFIKQAYRILKEETGELMIAEVQSRSKNWKAFSQMIQMLGFELINNGVSLGSKVQYGHLDVKKVAQNKDKYFRILHFVKHTKKNSQTKKVRYQKINYGKQKVLELSQLLLTECAYKKR